MATGIIIGVALLISAFFVVRAITKNKPVTPADVVEKISKDLNDRIIVAGNNLGSQLDHRMTMALQELADKLSGKVSIQVQDDLGVDDEFRAQHRLLRDIMQQPNVKRIKLDWNPLDTNSLSGIYPIVEVEFYESVTEKDVPS
jgi:hypothetical protein